MQNTKNIYKQLPHVDKTQRALQKDQKPFIVWFTGLSGSGKSTISSLLDQELVKAGYHTYVLDGDNVRLGLNSDLGFSDRDRNENIRRVGEVAKLMLDAGLIVLAAFISPFREERDMVRRINAPGEFLEVYVDAPLEVCEQRDPKGLYKKARSGEIKNFTGIDSIYEPPLSPEVHLKNYQEDAADLVQFLMDELRRLGLIR